LRSKGRSSSAAWRTATPRAPSDEWLRFGVGALQAPGGGSTWPGRRGSERSTRV